MPSTDVTSANAVDPIGHEMSSQDGEQVIPLLSEELVVTKRVVQRGTVRLQKRLEERTETIQVPLTSVRYEVTHIPVNQVVSEPPAIRYEGETTVYPVLGERLVVTRETVLLEEVHVTRVHVTTEETSTHTLQREQIIEEHIESPSASLS